MLERLKKGLDELICGPGPEIQLTLGTRTAPEWFRRIFNSRSLASVARCCFVRRDIFGSHVEGEHKTVGALELESLGALAVGFKLIRHHDEAIVAWRSPIFDVLEDRWFIGHALETFQLDLGSFSAVESCMRLVFVKGPSVDIALGCLERFPFHGKDMAEDNAQGLPLVWSRSLVEGDQGPIHLSLREVSAQIAGDPELGAIERGLAVMSLVDFVSVVEFAVVFGFAMLVVCRRLRIEVAHTEVWTTAGFNRGSIDRPIVDRRSCVTRGHAEQGCNDGQKKRLSHHSHPYWARTIYRYEGCRKWRKQTSP